MLGVAWGIRQWKKYGRTVLLLLDSCSGIEFKYDGVRDDSFKGGAVTETVPNLSEKTRKVGKYHKTPEGKSVRKTRGVCGKRKWKAKFDKTANCRFQGGNMGSSPVGDTR